MVRYAEMDRQGKLYDNQEFTYHKGRMYRHCGGIIIAANGVINTTPLKEGILRVNDRFTSYMRGR